MMFDSLESVLKAKEKSKLVSVAPSATVAEAVRTMNDEKIGAMLIMDQQKLLGIFTERDVLVRIVGAMRDPATTRISDVMTAAVRSAEPTTTVNEAFRLLLDNRHRHLPVRQNDQVRGMVSRGDLTRWVIRAQQEHLTGAIRAVKQMGMSNRRG
jgi:CBS domain-containing protein